MSSTRLERARRFFLSRVAPPNDAEHSARLFTVFAEQEIALDRQAISDVTIESRGTGYSPPALKPFDLAKALAGEKVVTREGKSVLGLHLFTEDTADNQRLHGTLIGRLGERYHETWWEKDGRYAWLPESDPRDLFMARTKREGWVNVYKMPPSGKGIFSAMADLIYSDRATADKHVNPNRVACIRIEWEE